MYSKNIQNISTLYDKARNEDEPLNSTSKPRENIDPIELQVMKMEKMRENSNKNITKAWDYAISIFMNFLELFYIKE